MSIGRRPLPRAIALLIVAGAAALGGCGGGDDTTTTTAPSATTTTTTTATGTTAGTATGTTTAPADGIDPMPGASTRPVTVPATSTTTALLTAVRAARHEGYDRVVFQFRGALPGYDVRYVRPPVREDGSGRAVTVAGTSVVRVRMQNALDADLRQDTAPQTYTGPTRLTPGTPVVRELVRIGGFENVLTWAIGLTDRVDFRVLTLSGPPRLIIDFRNH